MPKLNWTPDPVFVDIANQCRLQPFMQNATQFPGRIEQMHTNWRLTLSEHNNNVVEVDSSPNSIIESAQNGDWLLYMLKVGRWGGMIPGVLGQPFRMIYQCRIGETPSDERKESIFSQLSIAYQQLRDDVSISDVWYGLRDLGWSKVMISKCLHFMAIAAGLSCELPVAVDNAMAVKWLWPALRNELRERHHINWPRPGGINSNDFEYYNRYLSVIYGWSVDLNITMSQCEINLFHAFRNEIPASQLFA